VTKRTIHASCKPLQITAKKNPFALHQIIFSLKEPNEKSFFSLELMFQFTFIFKKHFSSRFFVPTKGSDLCVGVASTQKKHDVRCISLAAADKIDFPEQTRHSAA
jgi:hypothetical protein